MNCLNNNIYIKKNFKNGLLDLTETNNQINMTSEHSVLSNNWFWRHLNAKSFKMFLTL